MNIREQFNLIAKEYDENRRKFIPCFDDYYIASTDFVAKSLEKNPSLIFDLGSGTGILPSFWMPHFPTSSYVLVDLAEEMMDVAKKRFAGMPNVKYEIADYSEKLPSGSPDLVISALSIHHLEHAQKKSLFKMIFDSLPSGGVFVNYDQFSSENDANHRKTDKYWTEQIRASGLSEKEFCRWMERKKLDRECSVSQEINWMKESGFQIVDCIYFQGKFGVIRAEKEVSD